MGRLEIRVCGARNIGNVQVIGKPDPYVKVKTGDKKKKTQCNYKTRVVENNLNPVWNELFKFQIGDIDATQILFELWNDNVLVDDLLGTYALSINGLKRGVVEDMWCILSGTKMSSAELHLRVLAVDFGRDPQPADTVVSSIEADTVVNPSNQTYRPTKDGTPAQLPYAQVPVGLPQTVTCPANYMPHILPPGQAVYTSCPPPPPPAPLPAMYPVHQYGPPQPMYAPPPQPMYVPLPQQMNRPQLPPPAQMAYGVPNF